MKAVRTIAVALLAAVAMFGFTSAFASSYGKQKVVYHINYDDAKAQAGALRNINNHIKAVGAENLDAKVVLHGKGLSLLLDPQAKTKLKHGNADQEMTAKVSGLKDLGVKFNICANTLKGKKVELSDLFDVSKDDVVPSGVAELSALQMKGYTYIKP
ncbi:DsrE family protein [Kaarinaea lacus]